jgi:hypothetical protein
LRHEPRRSALEGELVAIVRATDKIAEIVVKIFLIFAV